MTFKHYFKHFNIKEKRNSKNELINASIYSKNDELIARLSKLYSVEFINDKVSIVTSKIGNVYYTYVFKEKDNIINFTKFILISNNAEFDTKEAYIKLDYNTLAINESGLYYLYDLSEELFKSDGFSKIEKQDNIYIGYYYIYISEYKLCITVYMDNCGKVIDNFIYIHELGLKIKYFYNLQITIKTRWKLIQEALNKSNKENLELNTNKSKPSTRSRNKNKAK